MTVIAIILFRIFNFSFPFLFFSLFFLILIPDSTQGLTSVAEIAVVVKQGGARRSPFILLPGSLYRSDPCSSEEGRERSSVFCAYVFCI